ncbi:hypothetical protein HK099_004870 [Clydaea vesicula]|uniref:Mediator of RNA polymerase II transcription subunit 11 n=1 Tax=Clydaea vesicula TaxID=447962 RepID=A0AAD5U2E2_9FUNG|nr:hypothetical protein HK099_004870 [Clydaea vesicula]KAJ3381314.1 hypothetical protein HDU92_005465 [Lobulomyces angularis]
MSIENEIKTSLEELYDLEQIIVSLLDLTSNSVKILSDDNLIIEETKEEQEKVFNSIMETIMEIQQRMRRIFRSLFYSGILNSGKSIPYKANLFGEEKDFELNSQGLALVLEKVKFDLNNLNKIELGEIDIGDGVNLDKMIE